MPNQKKEQAFKKQNQKYTFKSKFVNWVPVGAVHNDFVKNNPKGKINVKICVVFQTLKKIKIKIKKERKKERCR